ncbi:MAG: hypothetical protein EOP56_13785 [Sphingobacteriales bacterium]|nr:MAG: hypothetical protein EOP56_13785 [Sphingobacteriales bacterium]
MKSKWLIALIPIIYVSILFGRLSNGSAAPFEWDRLGYYSYLPAVFIYHDLGKLSFYPKVIKKYELAGYEHWYATYPQPEGKRLNKYAIGTSLFQLPFFLLAHWYNTLADNYPADGFSIPYQYAVSFSTVCWVFFALLLMRKFLLKYFDNTVVCITLACIALGTNLFDYSVVSIGMSHPYSFFLFAALLYCTDALYTLGKLKHLYWIAVILGIITIVRPVNLIAAIIPTLWKIDGLNSLRKRTSFFKANTKAIIYAALLFTAILFIQLAYWKYVTGHWLYFSYEGERFIFSEPEMWKGLFSFRKGWFIYTPIAFVCFIGFCSLWKKDRSFIPALITFFSIIIYVVFSWWNWYYGGTFGCRPLIETLALLSLPLAAFIADIKNSSLSLKTGGYALFALLITLNLFQTYQHSKNIIHYDRMTAAYYWKVFGAVERDPSLEIYLMDEEEYLNELKGRSK